MTRKLALLVLFVALSVAANTQTLNKGQVVHITEQEFKTKVFNYDINKEWKYAGTIPCIVDFYATWCGPCRQIAPILEALAKEYDGKILVYKIDIDKEPGIASSLDIKSLPTVLFAPLSGKPQVLVGAYPKDDFEKMVKEVLLNKTK